MDNSRDLKLDVDRVDLESNIRSYIFENTLPKFSTYNALLQKCMQLFLSNRVNYEGYKNFTFSKELSLDTESYKDLSFSRYGSSDFDDNFNKYKGLTFKKKILYADSFEFVDSDDYIDDDDDFSGIIEDEYLDEEEEEYEVEAGDDSAYRDSIITIDDNYMNILQNISTLLKQSITNYNLLEFRVVDSGLYSKEQDDVCDDRDDLLSNSLLKYKLLSFRKTISIDFSSYKVLDFKLYQNIIKSKNNRETIKTQTELNNNRTNNKGKSEEIKVKQVADRNTERKPQVSEKQVVKFKGDIRQKDGKTNKLNGGKINSVQKNNSNKGSVKNQKDTKPIIKQELPADIRQYIKQHQGIDRSELLKLYSIVDYKRALNTARIYEKSGKVYT